MTAHDTSIVNFGTVIDRPYNGLLNSFFSV